MQRPHVEHVQTTADVDSRRSLTANAVVFFGDANASAAAPFAAFSAAASRLQAELTFLALKPADADAMRRYLRADATAVGEFAVAVLSDELTTVAPTDIAADTAALLDWLTDQRRPLVSIMSAANMAALADGGRPLFVMAVRDAGPLRRRIAARRCAEKYRQNAPQRTRNRHCGRNEVCAFLQPRASADSQRKRSDRRCVRSPQRRIPAEASGHGAGARRVDGVRGRCSERSYHTDADTRVVGSPAVTSPPFNMRSHRSNQYVIVGAVVAVTLIITLAILAVTAPLTSDTADAHTKRD